MKIKIDTDNKRIEVADCTIEAFMSWVLSLRDILADFDDYTLEIVNEERDCINYPYIPPITPAYPQSPIWIDPSPDYPPYRLDEPYTISITDNTAGDTYCFTTSAEEIKEFING